MSARALPYAIILISFCAFLILTLQPLSFLLSDLVPDDGFYYFQIARNISAGNSVTFDSENTTNGFHPLWLATLVPIFNVFSDGGTEDVAPIRAALVLSAILCAVAGYVLLRVMTRYTENSYIQAGALALLLFNPYVLYEILAGLETPLSILSILAFLLAAVRYRERETYLRLAVLGALAGVMMLSRLDNVFYFLAFFGYLFYMYGPLEGVKRSFIAGIVATVIVAPWLAWNYANFGMLLTSSSVSSTIVNHELVKIDNGSGLFVQIKTFVYMMDRAFSQVLRQTGAPVLALLFLGAAIASLWARLVEMRKRIPVHVFLFGAALVHLFIHAGFRWTFRSWYFIPLQIFFVLFVAWVLHKWVEGGYRIGHTAVAAGACVIAAVFFIGWEKNLHAANIQQLTMYESTRWMNENLPHDSVVGIFNAGVQAYFSEHRVVNLDGLVNNEAAEALRARRLWPYLSSEGIQYVSDFDVYLNYRYRAFLGVENPFERLELIHRAGSDAEIGIWRVQA